VKNDPNQPEDAVSIDDRERILGGPAEAVGALDAVSGPPEEAARAALAQSARAILHEGRKAQARSVSADGSAFGAELDKLDKTGFGPWHSWRSSSDRAGTSPWSHTG
jgi:hypothetical protein